MLYELIAARLIFVDTLILRRGRGLDGSIFTINAVAGLVDMPLCRILLVKLVAGIWQLRGSVSSSCSI